MVHQDYEKVSDAESADPEKDASLLSLLTFWWMTDVFRTGAKRPLEELDFFPLQEQDDTKQLTEKIQQKWIYERKTSAESGKKPRFWKSVIKAVPFRQLVGTLCIGMLDCVCRIIQPLLLGFFITQLMFNQDSKRPYLYMTAAAIFFADIVRISVHHHLYYNLYQLGMRLRAALKGVVYLKILRVGQQTLKDFTTGQVMNLLSNDVQRIEHAPRAIFNLCSTIFDLIISGFLMYYLLGWAALVGMAFFILLIFPFSGFLAYIGGKFRKKTASITDQRILLLDEIISAIRTVKANAWEWIYRDRLKEIRRQEINFIRKKEAVLSTPAGLEFSCSIVAVFISVTIMTQTGSLLTPTNVFMLVSFMKFLRRSVAVRGNFGLKFVVESTISLGRIEQFLLLPALLHLSETIASDVESASLSSAIDNTDVTKHDDGKTRGGRIAQPKHIAVSFEAEHSNKTCVVSGVTLPADENGERYILQDISFDAPQGSLLVLTGPVGSGKSSVLAAINQEVTYSEGTIICRGNVAYVSQTPWVFPGTITENIIFGNDFHEERFNSVVEVCALKMDFENFPDGDQTIVGERGVVLSGGQQARISLARAVYADADVYLLDDPLSAVDAKVGEHIFEKCICGFLSTKTRLFVSHQVNHMKAADQIILMSKGVIIAKGSFTEMMKSGQIDASSDIHRKSMAETLPTTVQGFDEATQLLSGEDDRGLEIPEEDKRIGTVSLELYWKYFKAGLPTVAIIGLFFLFLLAQVLLVAPDVWLSYLVEKPKQEQLRTKHRAMYTGLVCGALFFALLRAFFFYQALLNCSEQLHDQMVLAILKAPVLFFDTNPKGRILNRFSKDVGCMDEFLPTVFLIAIQQFLFGVTAILLPSLLNPWLVLVVAPICVSSVYFVRYYLKSSRDLRRLESVCRSPIFSHVSETMIGLDTIRSRRRQDDFVQHFYRHQNKHNQAFKMCLAGVRWMGTGVGFLSALFTGAVVFSAVLISQDAAQAGLSLVYVLEMALVTQYVVQQASEVENQMTSVERVVTYTEIEPQPGYNIDTKTPDSWPRQGSISFNGVALRYYPGGPQVLRYLNVNIEANAKIGVAGRTGAGKSSVIAALLRMPEARGVIKVDDINIATLNLQESRRCVSVLSQKAVLFTGPLRLTLDPLMQHEDAELWRILEVVQLKSLVEHLEGRLDYEISEGGGRFSVGERQLLCLARVLLERNKILILDEPTAHVDPSTEMAIQNTVHDQLKECTVITVAHRLNTIRDCDKILVMDNGTAVEFDTYEELIKKEGGVFAEMVKKQS